MRFRKQLVAASQRSNSTKQLRQAPLQPFGNLLDIHQRHIPHAAFDATVIRSVQSASLSGLFLIDLVFLADVADGAAKADADVERHRHQSWHLPADVCTPASRTSIGEINENGLQA